VSPARLTATAVDRSLKLIRFPLDLAIGHLPGPDTGPGAAARLAVERLDASARGVLAAVLHDDRLTEGARRRAAAADERQRAVDLRRKGEARQQQAEERLDDRREQASERRERAGSRASSRRQQAERTRQSTTRRAKQVQGERAAASRRSEERNEEAIDITESARRLPGVEEQAEALREREAALARADEARRLGDAATRVKQTRQED
jgi:hypothetical protein